MVLPIRFYADNERSSKMSRFLGVDLHKNMFVVDFFDKEAGKHKIRKFKLVEIELFKKELRKDDVLGVE